MIPLKIQDQFHTSQNLQRSPIPQTSNWQGTFFAVSYSKPSLVHFVNLVELGMLKEFMNNFLSNLFDAVLNFFMTIVLDYALIAWTFWYLFFRLFNLA